jgi:catechol 2,3-dioxygenase-like lactoylglutathione lyase family enzyme
MRRFHVNVSVADLNEGVRFYSALFAVSPVVQKPDYAKWVLEDPRLNFAITQRGRAPGVNHVGFQVDTAEDLTAIRAQLHAADNSLVEQCGTACCYASSNKYWVTDPSGVAWETFHTLDSIPVFGEDTEPAAKDNMAAACCVPSSKSRRVTPSENCCA